MDNASVEPDPLPLEPVWRRHVSDELALLERLLVRHRERQRRYHRIDHVEAVVDHVLALAEHEPVVDLDAIVAAALYHDAIYEPQHPANERASARLARRDLAALGWSAARCDAVGAMIEGTAAHLDPVDHDTAVLFDADLAILGADPVLYGEYVDKIRAEYSHLDDGEWRTGRSQVLEAFLARDQLYATPIASRQWEKTARTNLRAELDSLQR